MITKKQPTRTCIACKNKNDKKNLIRIVKNNDEIKLDFTGKLNGRGAYICNDINCIEKCIKAKALNRAFGQNVTEQTYAKIKEDFLAGTNK